MGDKDVLSVKREVCYQMTDDTGTLQFQSHIMLLHGKTRKSSSHISIARNNEIGNLQDLCMGCGVTECRQRSMNEP